MEITVLAPVPLNATLSPKNIAKGKSMNPAARDLMHATQRQRTLMANIVLKTLIPMVAPSFAQKTLFCAPQKWTFLDVKNLPCVYQR